MAEPTADERRWATVVFADLAGFTRFAEDRDPEDVHAVVDPCLAMLADIVAQFGGSVMRVIGDEVMALFGAPVAHDDDPERAVRAALVMQERMAARREEFGGLELRVGINTGEMLFAPVGAGAARQPTVTGDVVNTAARLQSAAPEGGVLVGPETYRATSAPVTYEPMGVVPARGKAGGLRAWLAVDASAPGTREPLPAPAFVGRRAELDRLRDVWRHVTAGIPHLVTVVGDAGIGKTRLVDEFLEAVGEGRAQVLRGRALPYGGRTGYEPLADQLNAGAGVGSGETLETVRAKLDRFAAQVLGDAPTPSERAHLAALTGLGDGDAVPDRHALWSFVRRFVAELGRRRPTVLVFEDLQWAAASMLDLLELVAARLADTPLMLLATTRPDLLDARPSWATSVPRAVRLDLESLTAGDAVALARRSLGRRAVADEVDALAARAGGNPLFLVELAALGAASAGTQLPPTVRGVIAARLDRLPASARRLALSAAVAGRSFTRPLLDHLCPADDLDANLRLLEARQLVLREPDGFAFRHDLIREVAYATLTRASRREGHRALALHLERDGAPRTRDRAALLAHHWREAGETEAAVRYLVLAAEQAARSWASREAADLYGEASGLVPAGESARRLELRLARALALVDAGDYPSATRELEPLTDRLEGDARVEALLGWSKATFWVMDTATAQRVAQEAVDEARALGERSLLLRARGQLCLALSSLETRTLQGIAEGEAVADAWPADASPGDLATLLAALGGYHYWAGDFGMAVQRARRGYELGREGRRLEDFLMGASHLALGLTGLGRHAEALTLCAEAAAEGREHEATPRFTARLLNVWANVLRELGDVPAARELNDEAIELATRAAFPPPLVQGRIDLLFCDIAEGELGRASAAWPGLQQQAAAMRAWHNWLTLGRLATARAEIELGLGHALGAAEAAETAVAHARRVHRRKYEVSSLRILGEAQLRLREPAAALATLERCLRGARELGHPPSIWRAGERLAQAAAATGDDDRAARALALSRDVRAAFLDTLPPARRGGAPGADRDGVAGRS